MYQSLSDRFDRLDEKLEVLGNAVARYEERLAAGNTKFDRLEWRLDQIENRVNAIENAVSQMGGKTVVWERAAWVVFSAIIALLATYLK